MAIDYFRAGGVVEITIRDGNMAKIETHKFNIDDKDKGDKILHYIKKKYGFYPEYYKPLEKNPESKKFWSNEPLFKEEE